MIEKKYYIEEFLSYVITTNGLNLNLYKVKTSDIYLYIIGIITAGWQANRKLVMGTNQGRVMNM